jgi:hypothetical protein
MKKLEAAIQSLKNSKLRTMDKLKSSFKFRSSQPKILKKKSEH